MKILVAKYILVAWVCPILFVLIPLFVMPDPNRDRAEFSSITFEPTRVWVERTEKSNGRDFFELKVESPEGREFLIREPEPERVEAIAGQMPEDEIVEVIFSEQGIGNVILGLTTIESDQEIISFAESMDVFRTRRNLVFAVSGAWFVLGNIAGVWFWRSTSEKPQGVPNK